MARGRNNLLDGSVKKNAEMLQVGCDTGQQGRPPANRHRRAVSHDRAPAQEEGLVAA